MAKVRGAKGFDALFSRVFDEPGLKDAVDSLHDGFAHADFPSPPSTPSLKPVIAPDPVVATVTVKKPDPVSIEGPVILNVEIEQTSDNAKDGIYSGIDVDIDTSMYAGPNNGALHDIDAGIDVYPDTHPHVSVPINANMDANINSGMGAGTLTGIQGGTVIGTHSGIDASIDVQIPPDIDAGIYLYDNVNPDLWYPFTKGQGKVLLYLIDAGGKTNRNVIAAQTGVPLNSLAKTLSLLDRQGYIKRSEQKHYEHRERGFYYSIDRQMCADFYERVRGTHIGTQTGIHTGTHAGMQTGMHVRTYASTVIGTQRHIDAGTQPLFSSSFKEDLKTTTTEPVGILNDPELRYWAAEGVTEKQVQGWMNEFQMTADEIRLSLRYGRFDILERNDVQNAANWFYKILTKNGFYPRPQNYRSLLEIRAEALVQDLAREQEAKLRLAAAEAEKEFQTIMQDPTSETYQALLSQTNEYARSMDGQALETILRDEFLKNRGGGKT